MNLRISLAGFLLPLATFAAQAQVPVDSVNAGATPSIGTTWAASDVGWLFSPSSSYLLRSVETKFGAGSQPVTLVIYSAPPSTGGILLASGTFTVQPNV